MSNLSIEGLGGPLEIAEDSMISSGPGRVSELKVHQEMQKNGLSVPSQNPAVVGGGAQNFSNMLDEAVNKVNDYQIQADTAVKELIAGRIKNIHETMLAVERADLSMKLMVQVRNKMLDAYREIMRMQI